MTAQSLDFARTGPETLAGQYLRKFWQPVYRSQDLPSGKMIPIQIMSERFTLYRGDTGTPHVIAFRCAHRGTQLSTGWVEGDCVRCRYHGWKYDGSGQCVEQPGEDEANAAKVQIRSYPTQEYLGHIFAYLGAGETPPLRRFPDFERPGVVEAATPEIWPCNYFSRIENDPNHVPFVHRESLVRAGRTERLVPRKVSAEETEYGVRMGMSVPGEPPAYIHFHMPNVIQSRSRVRVEGSLEDVKTLWADRYLMHVPIDNENNVTFIADWIPVTGVAAERYQERRLQARKTMSTSPNKIGAAILAGKMRIEDMDKETPTYYSFWVEDYVTLVGQGPIADRANERLSQADIGVVFIRKIWERELRALADGLPLKQWTTPPGLADQSIVLPAQQSST